MTVITGLFKDPFESSQAIDKLVARGIAPDAISVVASDQVDTSSFGVETHSKLSEGAAIGAGTGGAIGALVAGFTAVGAITTGGLGLVAVGPIVAALAGAGAGAAAGAGLGGLVGLAIPEHEVKHYDNAIEKGAVLVGVHCEEDVQEKVAKDVFKACNADKISHA